MPILNYTTTVAADKTLAEIQRILIRHGARRLLIDYDNDGDPVALSFQIVVQGQPQHYRLPCRWQQVYKVMVGDRKVPRRYKTDAQALRVSWRIIRDWVEAQLAIVEASLVDLPEVFLPYAITPSGETLYEQITSRGYLLPGPSQGEAKNHE